MEHKNTDDEISYLKTLSDKEFKSYLIAKTHLGTSFGLSKSNGFVQWKKNNDKKKEEVVI